MNGNHSPQKKKYIFLLQVSVFLLLSGAYLSGRNATLIQLADIMMYAVILLGQPEDDFVTYSFILPMTGLMPTSFFRLFICCIISIIKIFRRQRSISFSKLGVGLTLYMVLPFVIYDYWLGGTSSFLTLYMLLLYIIVVCDKKVLVRVDAQQLARMLLLSAVLLMGMMLLSAKGSLLDYATSSNIQYRMGEENRDIGGAMGISLYACIGVAAAVVVMLRASKWIEKAIAIIGLAFIIFVTIFSISRTFFIAFAGSIVVWLFSSKRMTLRNVAQVLGMLLFIGIVGYFIYTRYESELQSMLRKLGVYMSTISSGSRPKIWLSCGEYMITHPLALLFGEGTNRYMMMQGTEAYAFHGYGSHSLVLDSLMSFGVVGNVMLVMLVKTAIKQFSHFQGLARVQTGCFYMPIALYAFSQLAQGSFRDLESYVLPFAIITIVYGCLCPVRKGSAMPRIAMAKGEHVSS